MANTIDCLKALWLVETRVNITEPCTLYVFFEFKDKRKRDLDNYLKPFIDCLRKAELLHDDDLIERLVASKSIGCASDAILFGLETIETIADEDRESSEEEEEEVVDLSES